MQKIGINKFKNKNKKYLKTLIENKTINIHSPVESINSLMIKPQCININLMKNSNKIKLSIKTDIKIIYLKNNDTSLYVYKTSYINNETIKLPKIFEGHCMDNPTSLNKIKKDIYTENINTKLLDKNIILSYFLVINISTTPTYYIAYNINNSFGDNIFLSHIDGQALTQKTFNQKMKCFNFKWDIDTSKLWFLAENNGQVSIYNIENDYKIINKIENVNDYENVNNFVILNKNEIILEYKDENNFYKLNTKRNQVKKMINDPQGDIIKNPYYDSKNKLLYFLMGYENEQHLYTLDKNNNVDIIFNYVNILDYYVSHYLNNLIIKIFNEEVLTLFEINISSKFANPIHLQETYEDILDVKFLYDNEDKKQILILAKNQNTDLILYDLNNYTHEILFTGEIIKFDIEYETLDIFIISKKNRLSYVEKINLSENKKQFKTILKLPANIKDIDIKKVPYEK